MGCATIGLQRKARQLGTIMSNIEQLSVKQLIEKQGYGSLPVVLAADDEANEFEKKVRRDMLAALNDRGSFHERLLWELTEANGYIGIKTSMDESDWETFLDTDAGAEAVAWWESRDVRFKISEWEKGVILYVDGVNPNTFHCTCFDFKTWGEYQHLAR